MPEYVFERVLRGTGNLSADQLRDISQTSTSLIAALSPDAKQLQGYVTGDKIYCVCVAVDEDIIQEHARSG